MWYEIDYQLNLFEYLMMITTTILLWGTVTLLRSPCFEASHMILGRSEPEKIVARCFAGEEVDEAEFYRGMAVSHDQLQHLGGVR